ncbi:unnamed protein product [Brassica oleracea]|uniref:(rape) hypothetical protein n=2 Tax=Brassica napus TaxID=3708 RepID=A0A816HZG6_BRANA|nr:unnamed protein product [Brassica napus]
MKNQRIQGSLFGLQLCLRLSVDEQKAARFNEPTNWAEKERTIYGFFGNSSLHHRYDHGSGSKNGVEPSPNIISSKYTQARGLINMNMIYKMFVFDRII